MSTAAIPVDLAAPETDSKRKHHLVRFVHSPTTKLIVRRLVQVVPVVIGVSFITFAAVNLNPLVTIKGLLGTNYTPTAAARLMAQFHFNQSFFPRYFEWLGNFFTGNWGSSYVTNVPVTTILAQRAGVTVELALFAFVLSLVLAVPLAVLSAMRPGRTVDRSTMFVSMLGLATPQFVLGLVLIIVFSVHLKLLPSFGYVSISHGLVPSLKSLLLPAIALAVPLCCGYVRILHADLIDQLVGEDYIVTARANGFTHSAIVVHHALRNSLFGMITVVAVNFSTLLGGAVIIEQVFSIPGMGQQLLASILGHDAPVVMAFDTLIATSVVLVALIADLLYSVLDPRVRHERADL